MSADLEEAIRCVKEMGVRQRCLCNRVPAEECCRPGGVAGRPASLYCPTETANKEAYSHQETELLGTLAPKTDAVKEMRGTRVFDLRFAGKGSVPAK